MPKIKRNMNEFKRNIAVNMRKNDYSLQEIGDTIGLTRERVRQILKSESLTKKPSKNTIKKDKKVGFAAKRR